MQFHYNGYTDTDPRIAAASGGGLGRSDNLPESVDVLVVGAGPTGHIIAAQLAQFPNISTRLVERRGGRLKIGHADGIQPRSIETFEAFGFANRLMEEAQRISAMEFWGPDPDDPSRIVRTDQTTDSRIDVSEYPHVIANQARVQDYFAEFMAKSPTRMRPDYGWAFQSFEFTQDHEYPITVRLAGSALGQEGQERSIRARYVVGCDGARSKVRKAIGRSLVGEQAMHAWGVMDVLAETSFPSIRTKCAIHAQDGGSILLIPREGGYLFRMYVDLGAVDENDGQGAVRQTRVEDIIATAQNVMKPYTLDVRHVAWSSVYEVAHRLTDKFDDVPADSVGEQNPRVFIAGDACHTHSAKAGQGMNVSLQDGFNLAWKIAHVLDGRSPASLLDTYTTERHTVARELIEFDKQWSKLMATNPEDMEGGSGLGEFYLKTFEFPTGLMTKYSPSLITGEATHQQLAAGFPIGKRFWSAPVVRVCDIVPIELGHRAKADGRWRIYVFADVPRAGESSSLSEFSHWLENAPESPVVNTPQGLDRDAWFDVVVVYQQRFGEVDITKVPAVFKPNVGEYQLADRQKVFAAGPDLNGIDYDAFEQRGIDRRGAVVVVRPDMYVAHVLPLNATAELTTFFKPIMQAAERAESGHILSVSS